MPSSIRNLRQSTLQNIINHYEKDSKINILLPLCTANSMSQVTEVGWNSKAQIALKSTSELQLDHLQPTMLQNFNYECGIVAYNFVCTAVIKVKFCSAFSSVILIMYCRNAASSDF